MFKKFLILVFSIFTLISCIPKRPAATPVPQQLVEETIAFVSPDASKEWTIDCGGVWVAEDLILTAYHCTEQAKRDNLSPKEEKLFKSTNELPDSIYAPIYFATDEAFDILDKGAIKHYNAVVVATDQKHDLALISAFDTYPNHRVVILATEPILIGDEIVTIGHPNGVAYSYTHGYVSGFHSGIYSKYIKTSGPFIKINAVMVGGNSGGGVFNSKGHLIGIASFIDIKAIQQGFVIPLGSIKKLIDGYNKNKEVNTTTLSKHT